jgi:hypothetical protein
MNGKRRALPARCHLIGNRNTSALLHQVAHEVGPRLSRALFNAQPVLTSSHRHVFTCLHNVDNAMLSYGGEIPALKRRGRSPTCSNPHFPPSTYLPKVSWAYLDIRHAVDPGSAPISHNGIEFHHSDEGAPFQVPSSMYVSLISKELHCS